MPISHIALHVLLCKAILQQPPRTRVAIHARVIDPIGRPQFSQTFSFTRGIDDRKIVAFDLPRGLYRVDLKTNGSPLCTASEYFYLLPDHNRDMDTELRAGIQRPSATMLVLGTTPQGFAYTQPTIVLMPGTRATSCGHPIGRPIAVPETIEDEQDAFYVSMDWRPNVAPPASTLLVLQTTDASGGHHYLRIGGYPPSGSSGFPNTATFDIDDATLAWIAMQPEDTLLCPTLNAVITGG